MARLLHRIASPLSLFVVVAISLYLSFSLLRSPPERPLSWDAFGYYLYLPATFLHQDLGLSDIGWIHQAVDRYNSTETLYQIGQGPNGEPTFKYSMGLAVLWAPFFALGHGIAWFTNAPQDGFSAPYTSAILMGSMLYVLLGLLLLRRTMLYFFDDTIVAALLILLSFGTNYWHQAVFNPTMPHVFLFTLHAGIILQAVCWRETGRNGHLLWVAFLVGLVTLTRPTDGLSALFPFLIGVGRKGWAARIWKARMAWLTFGIIILLVVAPQLVYWKWRTGQLLYNSYNNPGEGFEFLHPYIFEFLFSGRKGWLLYTPLMGLAIGGVYFMRDRLGDFRWSVLGVITLSVYILGSWSCWWYADSFGQRSMVQLYPYLALPLGALLLAAQEWKRPPRLILYGTVTLLLILSLLQARQSLAGLIHTSRMTWPAYKAVFGTFERPSDLERLFSVDRSRPPAALEGYQLVMGRRSYNTQVEPALKAQGPITWSGWPPLYLRVNHEFGPAFRMPWSMITSRDHAWFKVTVRAYRPMEGPVPRLGIVTSFQHDGQDYAYRVTDVDLSNTPPNTWQETILWYPSPEVRRPEDEFITYYWALEGTEVLVGPMDVEVYEPRIP